ncbi:hypothetical protein E0Z10_g2100 [Xylaria hypoxylon]|uniref:Uncharacterized protein n=1 Tax=Xylaria hypoxylon TaxID=37992 RepID=A0A4Z0Z6X8_9PEZI|nr:hypothetical protein E0Z10_g2100 [Xylaria hypoxylon]
MVAEDNLFVRFKNHIDSNVCRGLDILFGSSVATSTTSTSPSSTPSPTPSSVERHQQTSSASSSSILKMSDTSSNTASNADTSHQHSTSPTSPTTTVATTSTATIDDVHNWAAQSHYSPLNLQHLNQPTPRDAPRAWEGHFTFRDAFEDLLVAGSGQPLPTARELARRKFWEGNDRFPHRGPHVANWVNGLGTLGLWDAYFRLEAGGKREWRDRDERDHFQRRMRFREPAPFASVSVPGLRVGVEGWAGAEEREKGDVARGHFDAKGVWNGAWRVVRDPEQRWETDGEDRGDGDADVEDELYKANSSDFGAASSPAEGSGSDGKRKDLSVIERRDAPAGLRKPAAPEVITTVHTDGSRHVRETERSERDGRTEVSTTERLFDAQGNLLSESRGTSKTQTWSGRIPGAGAEASFSWSWNKSDAEGGSNSERDGDENGRWGDRKDEKSGWFWKR